MAYGEMSGELEASCDEAIDAVEFKWPFRNHVGDFMWLSHGNTESHTFVHLRLADFPKFICDSIANLVKTIAKIAKEASCLLFTLCGQGLSKFDIIRSCDLRPRCRSGREKCRQLFCNLANLADPIHVYFSRLASNRGCKHLHVRLSLVVWSTPSMVGNHEEPLLFRLINKIPRLQGMLESRFGLERQ